MLDLPGTRTVWNHRSVALLSERSFHGSSGQESSKTVHGVLPSRPHEADAAANHVTV